MHTPELDLWFMARCRSAKTVRIGSGYRFIDLFAGIGGFHQALHGLGAECVFASERDEAARKTYTKWFKDVSPGLFSDGERLFNRDIKEITEPARRITRSKLDERIRSAIPEFDVLCAGFPCQPFSQAGLKRGFEDERGNLFFDIEKIIHSRMPRAVFLENVRGLLTHDGGRTIGEIERRLSRLGYVKPGMRIVKASDHGVPQHRPRLFIVAFRDEIDRLNFVEPEKRELVLTMSDIFDGSVTKSPNGEHRDIGFTLRVGGKQSPIDDRRNWDGYWVDNEPRRLSPREGLLMQGFNEELEFPADVSQSDRMKQLGNSVAVPAVQDYAEAIFCAFRKSDEGG